MPDVADLASGTEFASYLIEQEIGRGGMGVVYRARDRALERPVAIKVIGDDRAGSAEARHRFEREARLLAAIDHPNVIPIYGAGEEDGHLYLVMRYVEGTDLHRLLRDQGRLAPEAAARIVDQVARAVDAAHARGLVHRDIKPSNVLLAGEHAYLADFGITRMVDQQTRSTEVGKWIGSVDFMSPEHLRGEQIDQRSDVYSLGCLLYTCLVGVPPFHRDSVAATITAHLQDRPPSLSQIADVPKRFDKVIAKALAKRPADRYHSAGELGAAALAAATEHRRGLRGRLRGEPTAPALAPSTSERTNVTRTAGTELAAGQPAAEALPERTRVDERVAVQRPASGPGAEVSGSGNGHRRPFGHWRLVPWIVAAVIVLAAAGFGVDRLLAGGGGGQKVSGPLSRAEIGATLKAFASDYSRRDAPALGQLLASNATRVDTGSSQHGRAAVLANYQRQFNDAPRPEHYTLSDVVTHPGWAARASGTYTLALAGGSTVQGHVVFGLERSGGHAVIALIATE